MLQFQNVRIANDNYRTFMYFSNVTHSSSCRDDSWHVLQCVIGKDWEIVGLLTRVSFHELMHWDKHAGHSASHASAPVPTDFSNDFVGGGDQSDTDCEA